MARIAIALVGVLIAVTAGQLGERNVVAALLPPAEVSAAPPSTVLASVNGTKISEADRATFLALRGLPAQQDSVLQSRVLEELIERELVRQFLASRKTEPPLEQQQAAVEVAKTRLRGLGYDPEEFLKQLGIDDERLRQEVSLPLAWQHHVQRVITDKQIREHFRENQTRFDGSRLEVWQIFIPYAAGELKGKAAPQTLATLREIRQTILAGTEFATVAKARSQAPTAAEGGKVGWIGPVGDLPEAVTRAAYLLKGNEISEPVLSPVGGHLVTVKGVQPGDISLEDARPQVIQELSQKLWTETVTSARQAAKIEP